MPAIAPPLPLPARWRVLGLACLAALASMMSFQMIPPLVGLLVERHGLSHGGAGLLMAFYALPGFLFALPAGMLSDRVGPARVAASSLILLTAGTFLMTGLGAWTLFPGRFLGGVGAVGAAAVLPSILHRHFPGPGVGLAMGLYQGTMPLGTLLAFSFAGGVALAHGSGTVFAVAGSLCAVAALAFFLLYREHPEDWERRKVMRSRPLAQAFRLSGMGWRIWALAGTWAMFNACLLGFLTFGGDFLHQAGYPLETANRLDGLPMLVGLPLVPVAGMLLTNRGRRLAALLAGTLIPAACVLLVLNHPSRAALWLVPLGAAMALIPPAVFTFVPSLVPPDRVGTAFGILFTVLNLVLFLAVPLAGRLRDLSGSYDLPFLFLTLLGLAGSACVLLLARGGERE